MREDEINLAVAKIEWATDHLLWVPDYCNDWEHIGPIIEREKIDLIWYGFKSIWGAHFKNSKFVKYAETPTKAAALCYLKMKGE